MFVYTVYSVGLSYKLPLVNYVEPENENGDGIFVVQGLSWKCDAGSYPSVRCLGSSQVVTESSVSDWCRMYITFSLKTLLNDSIRPIMSLFLRVKSFIESLEHQTRLFLQITYTVSKTTRSPPSL